MKPPVPGQGVAEANTGPSIHTRTEGDVVTAIPEIMLNNGQTIPQSGLDRDDLFVTSKLANDSHRPDDARRAFAER